MNQIIYAVNLFLGDLDFLLLGDLDLDFVGDLDLFLFGDLGFLLFGDLDLFFFGVFLVLGSSNISSSSSTADFFVLGIFPDFYENQTEFIHEKI
jgi:hypothetical protein